MFLFFSFAAFLLLCGAGLPWGGKHSGPYLTAHSHGLLIGNLWTIRRLHSNPDKVVVELSQKYGAICMLWLGSWPCNVISKEKVRWPTTCCIR
jgi:hypothetical protein